MKTKVTFNGKPIDPTEALETDLLQSFKCQQELERKFSEGELVPFQGMPWFSVTRVTKDGIEHIDPASIYLTDEQAEDGEAD